MSYTEGTDADLAAVSALREPTRRRVYALVASSARPLSREQVAEIAEIPRATAAFHLERLRREGMLEATEVRTSGRSGPGAGRPAKLYSRSNRDLAVSVPPRQYELAARILLGSVESAGASRTRPDRALQREAHDVGAEIGAAAGQVSLADVLSRHGFEPRQDDGGDDPAIVLTNCPFRSLISESATVCTMNLHLIDGVIDGLGDTTHAAHLDPSPGRCCVRVRAA